MRMLVSFLFFCLISAPALVQADDSPLTVAGSGTVDQVIDPITLRMDDGTLVTLAGIDVPDFGKSPTPPLVRLAYSTLQEKVEKAHVTLYQRRDQTPDKNAFGHVIALVIPDGPNGKDGTSLQESLLEVGVARVWDGEQTGLDLSKLLYAEERARQHQSGLWQTGSLYRSFSPETLPVTALDQLAVITGTVGSVTTLENDIYINLTQDGTRGFHLRIPAEQRAKLARDGFDPFALENQLIRARGIVRNGPQTAFISLTSPQQIEVISTTALGPAIGENGDQK